MSKPELFRVGDEAVAEAPYHYRECGLDNIYLMNGFTREPYDGDEYISVHDVDNLWKAIGLYLVQTSKTLSPKEIKFLRSHMSLTQADLASKLRVDDQTVARWEKGKVKLPGPADLALRLTFLASPSAQPEGFEVLKGWCDLVSDLVGKDHVDVDRLSFGMQNEHWHEQDKLLQCA